MEKKGVSGGTVSKKGPETQPGKRFGKYKMETEKTLRAPDVKEDMLLLKFKEAWGACLFRTPAAYYRAISSLTCLQGLEYDSKDIENLSLFLGELQEDEDFAAKAGLLLSLLINRGKDGHFTIHTGHLNRIACLGFWNTKDITVIGHGGDELGVGMTGGTITVHGSAGDWCGIGLKGGTITVSGDVEDYLGECMHGGRITVVGNAGEAVGEQIKGGEIHVGGDLVSTGLLEGGTIYHKGELVKEE